MPLSLPNEIWIEVIELLQQFDLVPTSRVSKVLHDLVEPALYRNLDLTKHKEPKKAVEFFFRTMINKPTLLRFVKHAAFCTLTGSNDYRPGTIEIPPLSEVERTWVGNQILKATSSKRYGEAWKSAIFGRQNYALVFELLVYMVSKNLESLAIRVLGLGCSKHMEISHLTDVIRRITTLQANAAGVPHPFSNLRNIFLLNSGSDTETITPFLEFKFLARLHLHQACRINANPAAREYPTSNLEFLEIKDSSFEVAAMKQFLQSLKALRRIKWIAIAPGFLVDLDELFTGANQLRGTLEELKIDDAKSFGCLTGPLDLTKFRALKRLEVSSFSSIFQLRKVAETPQEHSSRQRRLVTSQQLTSFMASLPTSLESLKITACNNKILPFLSTFMGYKDEGLSELKYIMLTFNKLTFGKDEWAWLASLGFNTDWENRMHQGFRYVSGNGVELRLSEMTL